MNPLSNSAIDKLGETLKHIPVSGESLIALDEYRSSFDSIVSKISLSLDDLGIKCTVRSKSTPSIIAKLIRMPKTRLTQLQDVAGIRVIVKSCEQQNSLRDLVVLLHPISKIIDRRENPSFGYRAVHAVIRIDSRLVELQIRTEAQHMWAALAESLADKMGHELKYGGGNEMAKNFLEALSVKLMYLETTDPLSTQISNKFTQFLQNVLTTSKNDNY